MFGDIEGIERTGITKDQEDVGMVEAYVECRGDDWFITYYVYEDCVEVVEWMDGNSEHCTAKADTLDEAIAIAGKWC